MPNSNTAPAHRPLADLPDRPYEAFSKALAAATAAGLLHTDEAPNQPWQRLTCPSCADRLDLPPSDHPVFPRYAVRAARRVARFTRSHCAGGQHR